jgi:replication factor A1
MGSNTVRGLDSILCLADKHKLNPNELFDAFIAAWKHGKDKKSGYTITCRQTNSQSGIFLISFNDKVISQFSIALTVLRNPDRYRYTFQDFKIEQTEEPSDSYLTIDELRFRMRHVNLKAKVVEKPRKKQVRTRWGASAFVSNVKIIDDTGSIRLSLWNQQIDIVNVGDEIDIHGGHVAQHAGYLQLRIGKKGTMSVNQR